AAEPRHAVCLLFDALLPHRHLHSFPTRRSSDLAAYEFQGFGRSVTPQQEVIRLASGQNLYKHQVGLFIFDRTQLQKNNIQNLVLGRFIAIVRGTKKDANAFEVYGLGNGLELQPGVINQLNENNGAYTVILATPENQAEALLPQTFFTTDYATTLAAVEALKTPTA